MDTVRRSNDDADAVRLMAELIAAVATMCYIVAASELVNHSNMESSAHKSHRLACVSLNAHLSLRTVHRRGPIMLATGFNVYGTVQTVHTGR